MCLHTAYIFLSDSMWRTITTGSLQTEGTSEEEFCSLTSGPQGYQALSRDAHRLLFCQKHILLFVSLGARLSSSLSCGVCLTDCRWVKWAAEHNGYLGSILRKALDSYLNGDMWVFLCSLLHFLLSAQQEVAK